MTNFLSSLYILEIRPLSDVGLVKIFSHSVGCHFVLLTMFFALQKLFSFRRSHLLIVSLSVCATGVIFRKWSSVAMCSSVLPSFSSMRFSVVGFMLRLLLYLDLSFVHDDRHGSIFILLHVDIQLCLHHLLNMLLFFPLDIFCFFVKNQVFVSVWINIWVFNLFPLVLLSVFMPIPSCFQYCNSVVEFKVRDCDVSRCSFIVQDYFGYPGFFAFPYKIECFSFQDSEELC